MSVRIHAELGKFASLPVARWGLWRDERWRKSAKWSTGQWIVGFVVFYFGFKHLGHGLALIIGQNLVTDTITYGINRKKLWPDRQVGLPSSGGLSAAATAFCFLYHKGAAILLVAVLGMGFIPAKIALAGIGVLENPLRYWFNDRMAFAEGNLREAAAARCRLDMCHAVATTRLALIKAGIM